MLPIDDVIERGRNEVGYGEKIEKILQKLSQNAYTTKETAAMLGISKPGAHGKLNKLERAGLLTKKFVDGEFYFFTNVDKVKEDPDYHGVSLSD